MSRFLLGALALAVLAPVASAQESTPAAVAPKAGQLLRDGEGRRLGPIESIQGDSVQVILNMHMYRIPTSTLSVSDKGLQTSLKRSELR
jgi:hypothetical protein